MSLDALIRDESIAKWSKMQMTSEFPVFEAKRNGELNVAKRKRSAYRIARQINAGSMVVNSELNARRAPEWAPRHTDPPKAQCPALRPTPLHQIAPNYTKLRQNILIFGKRSPHLLLSLTVLLCALAFSAR